MCSADGVHLPSTGLDPELLFYGVSTSPASPCLCGGQTQISMAVAMTIWLLFLSRPGDWCCPESSLGDSGSERTLRLSGAGRRQDVPGGVDGSWCLREEREDDEDGLQLPVHTPELDLSPRFTL